MAFSTDRTGWKKPGPPVTMERYDAIRAAVREAPDDLQAVAERFDLSVGTIRKISKRGG